MGCKGVLGWEKCSFVAERKESEEELGPGRGETPATSEEKEEEEAKLGVESVGRGPRWS